MADAARGDRSVDNRPVVYVAYPSLWLVNKAKVEPKTVQGILRPAKIQTTLDLYAQNDGDETRAAQGEYLTALGVATMVQ